MNLAKCGPDQFAEMEMLERAAKAAGIKVIPPYMPADDHLAFNLISNGNAWRPLSNEADALFLAWLLSMSVDMFERVIGFVGKGEWMQMSYSDKPNTMPETLRAIVRAASFMADNQ